MRRLYAAVIFVLSLVALPAAAEIHTAPVVIPGFNVKAITNYPVPLYRLFRSEPDGTATTIPFQIDEINEWGDFVLPEGGNKELAASGNGIFDLKDELSFMGEDVGPVKPPTKWPQGRPSLIFEIKLSSQIPAAVQEGAVYIGLYFTSPPPLSTKSYVNFVRDSAEVVTSRYRYGFDQKNWLVSRRVDMLKRGTERAASPEFIPLLQSTSFFMRADLKYFITVEANHRSINSRLEAYKIGPIRTIIRITFHYAFLRLNFELGMYTEVSFFSNAIFLPTILDNPIDGHRNLNRGSGFYYGLALKEKPSALKIETNMPTYQKSRIMEILSGGSKAEALYWVTALGNDHMIYMEISPSKEMRAAGAAPLFYREDVTGDAIKDRGSSGPAALGESPVNMALFFDMTKFTQGQHNMAFRLFFENTRDEARLQAFKNLGRWTPKVSRIKDEIIPKAADEPKPPEVKAP